MTVLYILQAWINLQGGKENAIKLPESKTMYHKMHLLHSRSGYLTPMAINFLCYLEVTQYFSLCYEFAVICGQCVQL